MLDSLKGKGEGGGEVALTRLAVWERRNHASRGGDYQFQVTGYCYKGDVGLMQDTVTGCGEGGSGGKVNQFGRGYIEGK